MGIQRQNGYSASVAAYLVIGDERLQVAKINGDYLTLAETCELAPKTEAELNIVIDEKSSTQAILLGDGVAAGDRNVRYSVLTPF